MAEKHNLDVTIRPAKKEDMEAVVEMIQELADFEKMSDGPKLSVKDLMHDGFEKVPPAFRSKVAELNTVGNKKIIGYAIYFPTYSTWEGQSMMLEDLYVRPQYRKNGVGGLLFDAVAKEAVEIGSSRLDFHVLEWNPACAFYSLVGAQDLSTAEGWKYYRLSGDKLRDRANMH